MKNPEDRSLTGKIALDMIGAVLLAAALGIVTAFVLASVTLLFVSQAEAAESPQQGTLLLRPRAAGEPLRATPLSTAVAFQVSGPVARARVVQTFRNPGSGWYEGIYVFPLPNNAAVEHLHLRVGERAVKGEIAERSNVVAARVAGIGPHQLIVVALEYKVKLRYREGSAQRHIVWARVTDELKDRGGERADRRQLSSLASIRRSPASAVRQAP